MSLPVVHGTFRTADDPNLRFSPNGVAVASVRAVASSRKQQDDGTWVDDKTAWVNITGFKQLAENMAASLTKGMLIVVEGRLEVDDWTDKDGNKRTSVNVIANTLGPALDWATASVTKNDSGGQQQRSQGGGGQQQQQPSNQQNPWAGADPWGSSNDAPPF